MLVPTVIHATIVSGQATYARCGRLGLSNRQRVPWPWWDVIAICLVIGFDLFDVPHLHPLLNVAQKVMILALRVYRLSFKRTEQCGVVDLRNR